ncbi:MAG: hypothetical protein FWE16_00640 [Firmicutes bacterium]|nr:hypothetical protein [Bacillota bacterium]
MKYFGTDGIRGRVGELFSPNFVQKVAMAVAAFLNENGATQIVIGHDTRDSCDWIVTMFCNVLEKAGIDVLNMGVVPTIAVSFVTRELGCGMGIMITASHNSAEWNGIKLFTHDGGKISEKDIERLEQLIDVAILSKSNKALVDLWTSYLVEFFRESFIGKKLPHIVIDCANGSGADIARNVLGQLGFNFELINVQSNGKDINEDCGAVYPENLQTKVRKGQIGFSFDGDADRCVVIDESGNVVHGDRLLAALGKYVNVSKIAATVLFNGGAEEYLKSNGILLIKTPVGDKYIKTAMQENNLVIGGETSGHIIFSARGISDYYVGDGLYTALMTLEMMVNIDLNLMDLTKQILLYPNVVHNIKATNTQKDAIKTKEFTEFVKNLEQQNKGYRLIIRPSGTEDVIRINVEGKCIQRCEDILILIIEKINKYIEE